MDEVRKCSIEGCTREHRAKGLCNKHYTRKFRTGTVELTREMEVNRGKTCAGPECDRPAYTKGLCATHYHQQYKSASGVLKPIRNHQKNVPGGQPGQRYCHKCQTWKDAKDDFYVTTGGKILSACKKCQIKMSNEYKRRKRQERKARVLSHNERQGTIETHDIDG